MLKAVLPRLVSETCVYRSYSAVTHGTLYGLMNFTEPEVAADESALLNWNLPPDVPDNTIELAMAAFGQASKRIDTVMGWGNLERDLWEIKLWKTYNR
jgi:hypothetical protein